ncbi:MAG: efflux RND transporter periplasmic adaptor subunit [Bacteroidetes bacterium]|nr:efflux RND transporter periplasmic adaptor subunit [Bacteroidota bacterium]
MKSVWSCIPVLTILLFAGCSGDAEKTTPQQREITESVYASGIVKAGNQYEVFATASGVLKEILIDEGDTVSAGDPLFVIDNRVSSLSAENARLAMEQSADKTNSNSNLLRETEGRLKLAAEKLQNDSLLFVRQKSLWSQQVGSKIDLEKRELAYRAAVTDYQTVTNQYQQLKKDLQKNYEQSQNNYQILKKQSDDFTIKSLFDGIVFAINKEKGELVTAVSPLAVIGQAGNYTIELQVDEYDIVKVKTGQRIFLSLDSYRGKVYEAAITLVAPIMNTRTRTFTVYAGFTTKPEVLYPNLTVEANILVARKKDALVIPAGYLLNEGKVLTAANETTAVTTGIMNAEWVEITGGIKPGQEIYSPLK